MLGWDPFREIAPLAQISRAVLAPAFEVKETKESFVFKADLPGIKEADIEVTVADNRPTVAGNHEGESTCITK